MKTFAAVLAAAALAAPALASCPNLCSGHGACGADDKCQCWAGYSGYDCSQRTCPQTEAWAVDSAEGPHVYAECAGKGLCDYTTGMCECFPGYEGRACERSSCANDCSGHGKCRMIADLPAYAAGFFAGPTNNVDSVYGWDEKAITACVCDGGYMGPDCSQRVCPFGDDPMTVCEQGDTEQIQVITVDIPTDGAAFGEAGSAYENAGCQNCAANNFAVQFTTYDKKTFYTSAFNLVDFDRDNEDDSHLAEAVHTAAADAMESLPNFAARAVTAAKAANVANTGTTGSLKVTFLHEGSGNSFGKQNLMQCPHPRAVGTDPSGEALTTYGCAKEGCQPRIYQPRFVRTQVTDDSAASFGTSSDVVFSDDSVLTCPTGVTCTMAGKDFAGTVVVAVFGGHAWVATTGSTDLVAIGAGLVLTGAAANGDSQDDFNTGLAAVVAANAGMTDFKYYGKITDHPEVTTGVHKVDISQMMMDTSIEITAANVNDAEVFTLQYTPARCNAAEDKTVDITEASGLFTGTPLDNYDIENMECSGRGQCDRASGACKCFEGYTGLACGDQTILI